MARLHVVIVNYNTADLLRRCLRHSLASATDHNVAITVVDNGSADDSLAMVRAEFPSVTAIRSERNLGFAGGNNLALRAILAALPPDADLAHEYAVLINTDLFLAPDSLDILAGFMEAHPAAGVVGPRVEKPDGTLDLACRRSFPTPANAFFKLFGLSRRFPGSARFAGYNLTHLDPGQLTEVDSVMGACMMVRLAAITGERGAGLLDESFFMYGEDLDWAYRIKAAGYRARYLPRIVVTHHKGESSRRAFTKANAAFYRAMLLFHRVHFWRRTPLPVNLGIVAAVRLRWGFAKARASARPAVARRVGSS
jgi:N-acetylglucosaminyl-diphospho-decaprenol L-rhamnosyltransferase